MDEQTYTNWFHVLVDDGSTDRTFHLISAAARRHNRRSAFAQENQGPGTARNLGIHHLPLDTKYILCLDSDDYLHPDAIRILVDYMEAYPHVGLLKWEAVDVDETGNEIQLGAEKGAVSVRYAPTTFWRRRLSDWERTIPLPSLFMGLPIYPSCTFLRQSVLQKTNGFPEEDTFRFRSEDTYLFIDMALHTVVHSIPDRLSYHRSHDGQLTSDSERMSTLGRQLKAAWHEARARLSPTQRERIEEALCYCDLRHPTLSRLLYVRELLLDRRVEEALRLLAGTVRDYVISVLPTAIAYRYLERSAPWAGD